MALSRKKFFTLASIGVISIFAALVIAAVFLAHNRPEKLFARFVATPVPPSVRVLDSDFVSGREGWVFFHVQISPKDFSRMLVAKRYNHLQEHSPAYKAFVETTYQRFRKKLPVENALASYEVYEMWSDPEGTVSYLIANPDHSELYAFSARF